MHVAHLLFLPVVAATAFAVSEPEFSDVFLAGKDGYKSIRIPAVVVTTSGTVLAFAEGRAARAD
ncbi:MAG TPA: sialidase family protein, partial [Chthoniobacteraceae bacterium]|nr:sialidase family protein [Chthoniobacteraceae bacterium]